jgi:tripartite-type tricarboxylate transporter receptor subunit TctC
VRDLNDGAEPERSSPVEFEKHLSAEIANWRKVVKAAGDC